MTRNTNAQITADNLPAQQDKHTRPQTIEIVDRVFEETYTAHITKKASKWHGWIPDVPEVKGEAKTKTELLKILTAELREALEAREEAWDKQLEADIKARKLDRLREEALEDIKAGRVSDL